MGILKKASKSVSKTLEQLSEELNDNVTIRGIKELFNVTDENIDIKTELEPREIRQILKLKFMGDEFHINSMQNMTTTFMRLRLSKDRKSRQEVIDMIRADITNELKLANSNKVMMKGLGKI